MTNALSSTQQQNQEDCWELNKIPTPKSAEHQKVSQAWVKRKMLAQLYN